MDYTSIPRSLIYEEKTDISEFIGKASDNSLEYQFFKKLIREPFLLDTDKASKYVLEIFNNALYICTLIYYLKEPLQYFGFFREKAKNRCEDLILANNMMICTMAMVYNWINKPTFKYLKGTNDDSANCIEDFLFEASNYFFSFDPIGWERFVLDTTQCKPHINIDLIEKRYVWDAIDDKTVPIEDVVDGIDYVCHEATSLDNNEEDDDEYSYYLLSKTLKRLEDTINVPKELLGVSPYQIDVAKEKVKTCLHELQYMPEDVEEDTGEKLSAEESLNEIGRIIEELSNERDEWKRKYEEAIEEGLNKEAEEAFNAQTENPCFTSKQMGILMHAIALTGENPPPGKTTIGEVVERISGYKAASVNQNMKGAFRDTDKKIVAAAIESKFPNLAAKVRKL